MFRLVTNSSLSATRRCTLSKLTIARSMFIATETTPNPHSMKFMPGQEVLPEEQGTGMVI